jgi:hypothetical protein
MADLVTEPADRVFRMEMRRLDADSSLPVVTKRSDGKYSVAISEGANIIWWSEPAGNGFSRFFVEVDAPATEFGIKECHGASHTIIDIDKSRFVRH